MTWANAWASTWRLHHEATSPAPVQVVSGVKWDQVADSYARTGALAGYALSASPGNLALPIQAQMRRCVVSDAGVVQYYLDPTDSTLKDDGTAAVLDGTDGQVMVEIPKFYYRYDYAGGVHTWEIANVGGGGFTLHPAFVKNGGEVAARYVGAYEGYVSTGVLASISGATPTISRTRAQFRTAAEARGSGWHQWDATLSHLVSLLYIIEYADLNSQAMIGAGLTDWASATWSAYNGYNPINDTGLADAVGNGTNSVSNGDGNLGSYMTYRGIENYFGHLWKFMDGLNVHNSIADRSRVFVCRNPDDFADDTATGYELAGLAAETDGYGATLIADSGLFYPGSVGATSASGTGDYHYTHYDNDPDIGWRVVLAGGLANHGALAGAFCVYSYNGSSIATANFVARLCF